MKRCGVYLQKVVSLRHTEDETNKKATKHTRRNFIGNKQTQINASTNCMHKRHLDRDKTKIEIKQ